MLIIAFCFCNKLAMMSFQGSTYGTFRKRLWSFEQTLLSRVDHISDRSKNNKLRAISWFLFFACYTFLTNASFGLCWYRKTASLFTSTPRKREQLVLTHSQHHYDNRLIVARLRNYCWPARSSEYDIQDRATYLLIVHWIAHPRQRDRIVTTFWKYHLSSNRRMPEKRSIGLVDTPLFLCDFFSATHAHL